MDGSQETTAADRFRSRAVLVTHLALAALLAATLVLAIGGAEAGDPLFVLRR